MWRHIRQCHSKEIPRFQLKEEELVRGETCLKRPPTPTFDDIGPAPEYTIDEEVETNANNNAKEDSDTSESESEEEDPEPPETKKPKMDAAISSKPVKPAAIRKTSMPSSPTTPPAAQTWAHEHSITESTDERGNRVVTTVVKFVYGSKDIDFPCCVKKY